MVAGKEFLSQNPQSQIKNSSIFPPDSAIWRITREQILLLGGPAAAILQIAHPEVAHGVSAHSDFRRDALGRLHRTLEAVYTITFSPRSEVEALAAHIHAIHAKVRGTRPEAYSAFSPGAQMWVLATLIQMSVDIFERFVAPLTQADREAFFADMRIFGRYFGLSTEYGPQDWQSFTAYYDEMLNGDVLASLPVCRELAQHIAFPKKPVILQPLGPISGFLTEEFLPSPVREKLGFQRTGGTRFCASLLDQIAPRILPLLPAPVRFARQYRQAVA